MATKKPWFPLYAADFLADTQDWSALEFGIYTRMLFSEWVNGPLVDDEWKLCFLCNVSPTEWKKAWPTVSTKFHVNSDGRLTNPRLEKERKIVEQNYKSKVKAGLASGKSRQKKAAKSSTSNTRSDSVGHPFPLCSNKKATNHNHIDNHSHKNKDKTGSLKTPSSSAKPTTPPTPVVYPEGLNVEAWQNYVEHRRDIKAKKLTDKGATQAQKKWAKCSPEAQMRAVEASIANGWTGCFPEKEMPGRGRETPLQKLHREIEEKNAD